ncbi:MAG: hypothetical protein Q8R47_00120 [Nanoarchaeota archaeon]|nr:hypothetical protein [Nanoarchaeota archaeon]
MTGDNQRSNIGKIVNDIIVPYYGSTAIGGGLLGLFNAGTLGAVVGGVIGLTIGGLYHYNDKKLSQQNQNYNQK